MRRLSVVVTAAAVCASLLQAGSSAAAPGAGPVPATGGPAAPASGHAPGDVLHQRLTGTPGRDLAEVDAGWATGTDSVATGLSGPGGYQVLLARESEGFAFRGLATLQPGGDTDDDWVGLQCLTGDGAHVLAVVAQRSRINTPAVRDRGGLAYSVRTSDGAVTPLLAGVAVKQHALGCGQGSRATLLAHLGVDQERTRVHQVDLATGSSTASSEHVGQLVSAVPVGDVAGDGVWAVSGSRVVDVTSGPARTVVDTAARPQTLRPDARGGADVLLATAAGAVVGRVAPQGGLVRTPVGARARLSLGEGTSSVAAPAVPSRPGLRHLALAPGSALPLDVSRQGKVSLHAVDGPGAVPGRQRALRWRDGSQVRAQFPDSAAPATTTLPPRPAVLVPSGGRTPGSGLRALAAATTTPTCAVPRNDPRKQALQPVKQQLDWAVQQSIRNALSGANGRPAGYLNMGLAAYGPSTDFPAPALSGWPGRLVPPSVLNGVLAQENAYRHASRRALPGLGGNPAIGDYYGSQGGLDVIDYADSDCGYGAAQVTDGMDTASRLYSVNGKTKIAVDYAENVQVGLKILSQKWNQLQTVVPGGIVLNGGDPQYVENWYFALWAYNSGVAPGTAALGNTTGCSPSPSCTDEGGRWGLGWTNNPANPDYPADRQPFLRATYADAERPGEWPYQERVLGFAETPIYDTKGQSSYARPEPNVAGDRLLAIPHPSTFCVASVNECSFGWVSPAGDGKDNCMRSDRRCWWNRAASYVDCPTSCHRSAFTYATSAPEPSSTNPYPPACTSTLPADAVVVDDLPTPYNVVGCGPAGWTSAGTFSYAVGSDASGARLGEIDFHQLAAGFGGHTWFTGNRTSGDTAHRVTGTWTPPALATGAYQVQVHVPRSGASASTAQYDVTTADGAVVRKVVDQHLHANRWISLGAFQLGAGAKVQLTNVTRDDTAGGRNTVAFDAVAFVPVRGTFRSRDIDSVAVFDRSTNIDTNAPTSYIAGPAANRQSLVTWARSQTSEALQTPTCPVGVASSACLGSRTKQAFATWDAQLASGTSLDPPSGQVTVPEWMGFSSVRPPAGRRDGTVYTNDLNYKIRSRTRVSWVQDGSTIVPGSASVDYDYRTGTTHMPQFARQLLDAIALDYPTVGRPSLRYNAVDLNRHDHQVTSVDATTNGLLPGRAYRTAAQSAEVVGGTCVKTLITQGGSIGYRPMLGEPGATGSVEAWKERAKQAEIGGTAPPVVARFAEQLKDMFFDTGAVPGEGSAFRLAPPIWQEVNALTCTDGTVKAAPSGVGPVKLMRQSHMPDGYLYLDGVLMDASGRVSTSAAPLTAPVQRGNFQLFSNIELESNSPNRACIVGYESDVEASNGNPWGMTQATGSPGDNTEDMIHCHDPFTKPDAEQAP